MPEMKPVKLMALDDEDLAVISAHVQDAVMKVGDIRWLAAENRLIIQINRFVWEGRRRWRRPDNERRLAVLHFDRVLSVKAQGVRADKPETVLSLLAVTFAGKEAPAGTITLFFSGEATMKLDVECIEAQLADLGAAWGTHVRPKHPLG